MFDQVTNKQNLADSIKAILESAAPIARGLKARDGRHSAGISRHVRRAYELLQRFERADWIPGVFEEALRNQSQGKLQPVQGGWLLTWTGDIAADAVIIPTVLADVLNEYLIRVSPPDVMDSQDARIYLGMSETNFKKHVYRAGNLTGTSTKRGLVFTREELDEFKANRRKAGRPATLPAK